MFIYVEFYLTQFIISNDVIILRKQNACGTLLFQKIHIINLISNIIQENEKFKFFNL